jgi:hypothetical protein
MMGASLKFLSQVIRLTAMNMHFVDDCLHIYREHELKFTKMNVGSNKLWYSIFLFLLVVMCFSPTIVAIVEHLHEPYVVRCQTFSLRIPMFWSLNGEESARICTNGIALIRSAPTIFGSADYGSSLIVLLGKKNHTQSQIQALEDAFRIQHPGDIAVPFILSNDFNRCLLTESRLNRRTITSTFCLEDTKGITILFAGSRHALKEVSALIKVNK